MVAISVEKKVRDQKVSFTVSALHQSVHNSEQRGAVTVYQYISGIDCSMFLFATSGNKNIPLPRLHIFPANYVPINGKKTADTVKSAACISKHERIESCLNEILQWPRNFFK
jgi:hypothetical protein